MDNFRLYTFVNHVYMSPLQWGIQTAHVVSTMMSDERFKDREDVKQWAKESPTIIVCRGGNFAALTNLSEYFAAKSTLLDLPYASFHEDEESLGGILTCAGILVPRKFFAAQFEDYMYDNTIASFYQHETELWNSSSQEYHLIDTIQSAKLA